MPFWESHLNVVLAKGAIGGVWKCWNDTGLILCTSLNRSRGCRSQLSSYHVDESPGDKEKLQPLQTCQLFLIQRSSERVCIGDSCASIMSRKCASRCKGIRLRKPSNKSSLRMLKRCSSVSFPNVTCLRQSSSRNHQARNAVVRICLFAL